jgi:hypothetical protein
MKNAQDSSDRLILSEELRFKRGDLLIRWMQTITHSLSFESTILNDPVERSPEKAIIGWIDEVSAWNKKRFHFRRSPKLMFFIRSTDPDFGIMVWDITFRCKDDFIAQITLHESERPLPQTSVLRLNQKLRSEQTGLGNMTS